MSDTAKPWAGRFNAPTDAFVEAFTASVGFDHRLYRYDIRCSIAHATMLASRGILTDEECAAIVAGLERVRERIESGGFDWSVPLEDVHMNVETALTADIGEPGKKLHTGRSRNDQVATDIRLFLREEIDAIRAAIGRLKLALLDLAEPALQSAAAQLAGGEVLTVTGDVTRPEDCQRAVAQAVQRFGRIDLCWANAGIGTGAPLRHADPQDWMRVVQVNVFGVLHTVQAALPQLIERRA